MATEYDQNAAASEFFDAPPCHPISRLMRSGDHWWHPEKVRADGGAMLHKCLHCGMRAINVLDSGLGRTVGYKTRTEWEALVREENAQ